MQRVLLISLLLAQPFLAAWCCCMPAPFETETSMEAAHGCCSAPMPEELPRLSRDCDCHTGDVRVTSEPSPSFSQDQQLVIPAVAPSPMPPAPRIEREFAVVAAPPPAIWIQPSIYRLCILLC